MAEAEEFLFNRNRMKDVAWLRDYLTTLNGAKRLDSNESLLVRKNEMGQEYYILETDGFKNDELYVNKGNRIYTWDFILPGSKKNTFSVYTVQADYRTQYLEGEEMDDWVQKQLRENPSCKEEDFCYMSVMKTLLNKCSIYHGRDICYEETYFSSKSNPSLPRLIYTHLMYERAFQPIRNLFASQYVPPVEQVKSAVLNRSVGYEGHSR